MIDTAFDFYSDTPLGKDPDALSPTLRRYHQILWSKPLPNGEKLDLSTNGRKYLTWKDFVFGSDAITNSYRHRKKMASLIADVMHEADELFQAGSTIGAYTIFPSAQIDRKNTINQARGVIATIDDRFDLTLECIRRHYSRECSPLSEVLSRYGKFFDLFYDFRGYVDFFLLQDLVDDAYEVKFFLPFDNFERRGAPSNPEEYRALKEATLAFIQSRAERIQTSLPKN